MFNIENIEQVYHCEEDLSHIDSPIDWSKVEEPYGVDMAYDGVHPDYVHNVGIPWVECPFDLPIVDGVYKKE